MSGKVNFNNATSISTKFIYVIEFRIVILKRLRLSYCIIRFILPVVLFGSRDVREILLITNILVNDEKNITLPFQGIGTAHAEIGLVPSIE